MYLYKLDAIGMLLRDGLLGSNVGMIFMCYYGLELNDGWKAQCI